MIHTTEAVVKRSKTVRVVYLTGHGERIDWIDGEFWRMVQDRRRHWRKGWSLDWMDLIKLSQRGYQRALPKWMEVDGGL